MFWGSEVLGLLYLFTSDVYEVNELLLKRFLNDKNKLFLQNKTRLKRVTKYLFFPPWRNGHNLGTKTRRIVWSKKSESRRRSRSRRRGRNLFSDTKRVSGVATTTIASTTKLAEPLFEERMRESYRTDRQTELLRIETVALSKPIWKNSMKTEERDRQESQFLKRWLWRHDIRHNDV